MEILSEDIKLLIVSYLTGELNEKDLNTLKNWLKASQENVEYFNKLRASWDLAGKGKSIPDFNAEKSWNKTLIEIESNKVRKGYFNTPFIKTAATWLLLIALGSLITLWINRRENKIMSMAVTQITAPLGAKSIINMPDGTKVWLNAGSKLVYNSAFNDKDRVVELIGEAYFHVKTDASKPFIVKTTDVIVRALGTRFNVKAYPDEKTITTTLEEGKIDVQLIASAKNDKIVLKPNENIVFYKRSTAQDITVKQKESTSQSIESIENPLQVEGNVKTELYTSWKEEKWIIESEPLSTLIPKLERKFNLTIAFSDKELMKYKFSGSFKNETAEQILKALSFTAPIDYTIEKEKITLKLNQQLKEKYTRIITPKK